MKFDNVQMVRVISRLDRGADPVRVCLEVVEADFDAVLRRRVRAWA